METKTNKKRIDWHAGFAGGLELSFRKYSKQIDIDREYELTKQSPRIDFIVIKKAPATVIDNAVGRAFRKYNIIEYKNPNDALNIDVIWKCIGYAGLYKGLGGTVDAIPEDELTITIFRSSYPRKLFGQIKKSRHKDIENPYPGVYLLKGFGPIPIQVVVTRQLTDETFLALKVMMHGASEVDVRHFITETRKLKGKGVKNDADAVLVVSAAANKDLYRKIGKESEMNDVLEEILKDKIDASNAEAEKRGEKRGEKKGEKKGAENARFTAVKNLMDTFSLSAKDAMKALKISAAEQKKFMAML